MSLLRFGGWLVQEANAEFNDVVMVMTSFQ